MTSNAVDSILADVARRRKLVNLPEADISVLFKVNNAGARTASAPLVVMKLTSIASIPETRTPRCTAITLATVFL